MGGSEGCGSPAEEHSNSEGLTNVSSLCRFDLSGGAVSPSNRKGGAGSRPHKEPAVLVVVLIAVIVVEQRRVLEAAVARRGRREGRPAAGGAHLAADAAGPAERDGPDHQGQLQAQLLAPRNVQVDLGGEGCGRSVKRS